MHRLLCTTTLTTLLGVAAVLPVAAQDSTPRAPTLNFYLNPGLIDMPSGEALPDSSLATGLSDFSNIWRTGITFQFSDRLSGTFRYSGLMGLDYGGYKDYYDRSFDLRLLMLKESTWLPSVTVGLQDLMGTGLYSAEYIAATKELFPGFKVTAGLGWGRLGSYGAISDPFGPRPADSGGQGGTANFNQWFRGPMAPFGGIEWRPSDRLGFKVEYSSDAYTLETQDRDMFERKSPLNFGVEYQVSERLRAGAYYMYGSEFGVNLTFLINPYRPPTPLTLDAPRLIEPRPAGARPTNWASDPAQKAQITDIVRVMLEHDGLTIESLDLQPTVATLRFQDQRFDSAPNGIGRAARALAAALPSSVETFRIVPVVWGQPTSMITVRRSDLESLEFSPQPGQALWARSQMTDAGALPAAAPLPGIYPNYFAGIEPYVRVSYFDPDSPFRGEVGLRAQGDVEIMRGLVLEGSVRKPLAGNLDDVKRVSNSVLPHVRTDWPLYDATQDLKLEYLTLSQYFRPGKQLWARITAGYLEDMYAGLAGEVLWSPVNSPLSLGLEVARVGQRDFDMGFGLQDYTVTTGFASAYYRFGQGYVAQVNAGQYLAGDRGATFSVDRYFADGFSVGAFFTLTNVSFKDFGEGSFDKGIRVQIPLTWFTGRPSQTVYGTTIRPVQRDGGQPLNLNNRLYSIVQNDNAANYEVQWGRFWR